MVKYAIVFWKKIYFMLFYIKVFKIMIIGIVKLALVDQLFLNNNKKYGVYGKYPK